MLDVDEFKRNNDHNGHRAGDDCLRAVGARITGALQRAGDFAARWGGEEFVVLLPGADAEEILAVGERIREDVERLAIPHAESETTPLVTISLGATLCRPRKGDNPQACVEAADRLLYRAKLEGRNRLCGPSGR